MENKRAIGRAYVPARIIAVVSGRGGVGKSLISLGLLEHYSRRNAAMLVDFDLHNRGLTSLLYSGFSNRKPAFVFDILQEFLELDSLADLRKAYNSSSMDEGEIETKFDELVETFSNGEVEAVTFDAYAEAVNGNCVSPPLSRSGASFLASIAAENSLLSCRKVRDAGANAAFLFFKALTERVSQENGIRTVIFDCHGAHDLYTVGLIRAATDLVIVTTPEMGGLDGTRDLVAFAKNVNSTGNTIPRSVLIVNRCLPDDPTENELESWWNGTLEGKVVRIEKNEKIERIAREYTFGSVAQVKSFWQHIETVGKHLDQK